MESSQMQLTRRWIKQRMFPFMLPVINMGFHALQLGVQYITLLRSILLKCRCTLVSPFCFCSQTLKTINSKWNLATCVIIFNSQGLAEGRGLFLSPQLKKQNSRCFLDECSTTVVTTPLYSHNLLMEESINKYINPILVFGWCKRN